MIDAAASRGIIDIPFEVVDGLRRARSVAVLTGAGVSAESGVPTFRDSQTGYWARYRAEELATPEAFRRNPLLVWEWYRMRQELVRQAEPNAAHRALAALERSVPQFTLITQNVDDLHRRAGSVAVIELHGSLMRARCTADGSVVEVAQQEVQVGWVPRCRACRSLLRPDVVWFGEPVPSDALLAAWDAAGKCDVFLTIGTSNAIEPAASLPWFAAAAGANVVVVNTTMDGQRAGRGIWQLQGPAGDIVPALLDAAWPQR